MVSTTLGKESRVIPTAQSFFLYYCVAIILCLLNFLPIVVKDQMVSKACMAKNTENLLNVCYFLSIPLLIEFILDTVASQFQTLNQLNGLEHRIGHGLLLVSMFLAVIIVNVGEVNSFLVNCFFSALQTLVLTAMFGKLQYHSNNHWNKIRCWCILSLFVFSEICTHWGMLYHGHDKQAYTICIALSFVFLILCLVAMSALRKNFLAYFLHLKLGKYVPPVPKTADDIVCLILQAIIMLYLVCSISANGAFLIGSYDKEGYTNMEIIKQIVLALSAAILPGRMIRRSFLLLKHEMDTKEAFVRYVSHEIRSPLSTTTLGLDYLIERMSDNSISTAEALSVVQESRVTCELAMNTLNDFLMLDKIQSNMLQISTIECAASDFIVNTMKAFKLQAQSDNISLKCTTEVIEGVDILNLPITVEVDAYKINQVIRNLFSNALKFTPAGGTVEVTMSLRDGETESVLDSLVDLRNVFVRYSVKDSGCGIKKENLPKLFGQYVQFDADKLQGGKGSGLGLWLSKAIVELHGGMIGATSEGEGQGSTFFFEIPCTVLVHKKATALKKSITTNTTTVTCSRMYSVALQGDDVEEISTISEEPEKPRLPSGMPSRFPSSRALSRGASRMPSRMPSRNISRATSARVLPDDPMKMLDLESQPSQHSKISRNSSKNELYTPPHSAGSVLKSEHSSWLKVGGTVTGAATSRSREKIKKSHTYSHINEELRHPCVDHSSVTLLKNAASRVFNSYSTHGLRILLVDDSSIARKMVERNLAKIDAICTHAENGKEAVVKVEEVLPNPAEVYDVILIDYHMPEMNGPEAVVAIRALGYEGVIIAVSGMDNEEEFGAQLEANLIDRIMVKPFNLEIFQGIVNDVKYGPLSK